MADWTLLAYTERAVVIGEAAFMTEIIKGRFGLDGWSGDCTRLLLRFEDESEDPEVLGEVCDDELSIPVNGDVFKKRR